MLELATENNSGLAGNPNTLQTQKREYLTQQAKNVLKRTAQDILDLSQICHEYRQEFGYQDYIEWVKNDLGLAETMGKRMLNVAERFSVGSNLDLKEIHVSALYALAAPSVPESARQEAIDLAESGEKVTHADAQELIRAHKLIADHEKRIAEYDDNIRKLKSQLPTTDVLQQIAKLQADLIAEKDKGPVEVVKVVEPEDYQKVKQERQDLLAKLQEEQRKPPVEKIVTPPDYEIIKKEKTDLEIARRRLADQVKALKEKHEKELKDQDARALREVSREIQIGQKQIAGMEERIETLRIEMQKLDKSVGALTAYKEATQKVRHSLYDISIVLQDVFMEYPIPDEYMKDLKYLANEMRKGTEAFENFLDGKPIIGD